MGRKRSSSETVSAVGDSSSKKSREDDSEGDKVISSVADSDSTIDTLNSLSVAELKEQLQRSGKKVSGKKNDLVKRLLQVLRANQDKEAEVALEKERNSSYLSSSRQVSLGNIPIVFLEFAWDTVSNLGNIWAARSNLPLTHHVYYWEITVNNLEKQYQYEYTQLGICTAAGEQFYVDGNIGEIIHSFQGQFRGYDIEKRQMRSMSSGINVPEYRIRLKDGDTIGFLLDLRDDYNRTLALIPRRNYSCDPLKPHTQPILCFATPLLKLWEHSINSFGSVSLVGRIPPKIPLYAFASVGQLGKRFFPKLLQNPSEYYTVQRWKDPTDGSGDDCMIPPLDAIEHFLLHNPSTTLSITTLSSKQYDPELIAQVERDESDNPL